MVKAAKYILYTTVILSALCATAQDQSSLTSALRVETEPAEAQLRINGQGPYTTPYVATDLAPGTHIITIEKRGFKPHRQTLTLAAGERAPLSIQLQPLMGLLLIHTEPEDVAVTVDGMNKGATPLLITDLPVGRQYTMQLSKSGYITKTIELDVTGRAPKHIVETLTPSSATLTIASTPPGASITLNGASHGTTPATINRIPEGTATLALNLDGHKPFSSTLRLSAGQRANINAELEPIPASMRIVSIPEGARIYVNNEYQGRSPVELQSIPPGEYRIRGEAPGFAPTARTINLAHGATATEEIRLISNAGKLEIVTQPAGVKVFINGRERGTTGFKADATDNVSEPLTIDLIPEGEHEVTLSANQYYPLTFTVEIKRDQTTILQPQELRRRFIPNLEVRTTKGTHTGVYLGTTANGDIRLEVRPGIIQRIPRNEVLTRRPLRAPTPDP